MLILAITFSLALSIVDGSTPVARWEFESETDTFTARGNVSQDQPGPRPPEFPDMPATNTAVRVDAGAYLAITDKGAESDFDFSNGDEITIEAWVNPTTSREGQPTYIIGKGRTGSPKFRRDNQNWALRFVSRKGEAHLSFLFATKLSSSDQHWHRWTSTLTFPVGTGWHHVAVSYRFGEPDSVRGWINGKPTAGTWDMGGATKEPPVVDDDEIRIGTGFVGSLDAVAIHRGIVDEEAMENRFRRVGSPRVIEPQQEVMPAIAAVPEGRVVAQICEGLPTFDRWLNVGETWPAESARWIGEEFLLPRIPLQFDGWGIRKGWQAPSLLRMAGDVHLKPGKHQLLVRARALGRLWVNGELVVRTNAITRKPPDGEEPVTPVVEPPLPGLRPHGYKQQEVFGEVTVAATSDGSARRCRVVFEVIVGGSGHRTESGEICIARLSDDGKTYELLSPRPNRIPLTDEAIEPPRLRGSNVRWPRSMTIAVAPLRRRKIPFGNGVTIWLDNGSTAKT